MDIPVSITEIKDEEITFESLKKLFLSKVTEIESIIESYNRMKSITPQQKKKIEEFIDTKNYKTFMDFYYTKIPLGEISKSEFDEYVYILNIILAAASILNTIKKEESVVFVANKAHSCLKIVPRIVIDKKQYQLLYYKGNYMNKRMFEISVALTNKVFDERIDKDISVINADKILESFLHQMGVKSMVVDRMCRDNDKLVAVLYSGGINSTYTIITKLLKGETVLPIIVEPSLTENALETLNNIYRVYYSFIRFKESLNDNINKDNLLSPFILSANNYTITPIIDQSIISVYHQIRLNENDNEELERITKLCVPNSYNSNNKKDEKRIKQFIEDMTTLYKALAPNKRSVGIEFTCLDVAIEDMYKDIKLNTIEDISIYLIPQTELLYTEYLISTDVQNQKAFIIKDTYQDKVERCCVIPLEEYSGSLSCYMVQS